VRNDARAAEAVQALVDRSGHAVAIQANLAWSVEVKRLFDEAERAISPLDIVVGSAADCMVKSLVDCSEEDYDRIFDTNTKGVIRRANLSL